MAVPPFFNWLLRKYPNVILDCVEERPSTVDRKLMYKDSSLPNPNDLEFDNLYLDMNFIFHQACVHSNPGDKPAPKDEDEMMVAIFDFIDRIFRIVRPRKLLYMAVDGVAPRAKMNQQRMRRYLAIKEAEEKMQNIQKTRSELQAKGDSLLQEKPVEAYFDINSIAPGTPFMDRLNKSLHYYIHDRLNNDLGWKDIKVIFSDSTVPGDGEHKIMDYIRRQRAQPDYDPNTEHVLCGGDAHLVMLGLATHEPNFTILREEFRQNKVLSCATCGQIGHETKSCMGSSAYVEADSADRPADYIFVLLSVLREYLERELSMTHLPFAYDFERALDDWVFLCILVSNDFLPPLFCLDIDENAIDRLINIYKHNIVDTGGWLTESGEVRLERLQYIIVDLSYEECEIFQKRHQDEINFRERQKKMWRLRRRYIELPESNVLQSLSTVPACDEREAPSSSSVEPDAKALKSNQAARDEREEASGSSVGADAGVIKSSQAAPEEREAASGSSVGADAEVIKSSQAAPEEREAASGSSVGADVEAFESSNKAAPDKRKEASGNSVGADSEALGSSQPATGTGKKAYGIFMEPDTKSAAHGLKRSLEEAGLDFDDDDKDKADEVRLWEVGFKERYYWCKFKVSASNIEFRHSLSRQYALGLCWVLQYYYQGCPNWKWYFPYHFPPFTSDFVNINLVDTMFEKGTQPLRPLEQLMCALPPASAKYLPETWAKLMTDPLSPISEFYPTDFDIDLNGKQFIWEGVALLPFIDEAKLLKALVPYYKDLTNAEKERNMRGYNRLYVASGNRSYAFLDALYENAGMQNDFNEEEQRYEYCSDTVQGCVLLTRDCVPHHGQLDSPVAGRPPIVDNAVVCVRYEDPQYEEDFVFPARRLPLSEDPPRVLIERDFYNLRQYRY
ncbi:hypothetical protein ACJJTC_015866 [Scirpophaga incertulas]